MKHTRILTTLFILVFFLSVTPGGGQAGPPLDSSHQALVGTSRSYGSTFTYQGYLTDGGRTASGTYDFRFNLYDASSDGNLVGSTVELDDVTVSGGVFSVQLNFGAVFDGTALWLEAAVRPGDSTGAYTTLSPRQALTAVPYAWHALDSLPVLTRTVIDYAGDVGEYTAITTGADGLGLISYRDKTDQALKVAHCQDTACISATCAGYIAHPRIPQ